MRSATTRTRFDVLVTRKVLAAALLTIVAACVNKPDRCTAEVGRSDFDADVERYGIEGDSLDFTVGVSGPIAWSTPDGPAGPRSAAQADMLGQRLRATDTLLVELDERLIALGRALGDVSRRLDESHESSAGEVTSGGVHQESDLLEFSLFGQSVRLSEAAILAILGFFGARRWKRLQAKSR